MSFWWIASENFFDDEAGDEPHHLPLQFSGNGCCTRSTPWPATQAVATTWLFGRKRGWARQFLGSRIGES